MQMNDVPTRGQREENDEQGEDPVAAQAHPAFREVEDPLARFFEKNKKGILITVAVGLALYYALTTFQESRAARQAEAADLFRVVQSQFEEVSRSVIGAGAAAKRSEEEQKKLDEQVTRLRNSLLALRDREGAYGNLAIMYEGMLEGVLGEPQKATSLLTDVSSVASKEQKGLLGEVSALSRARLLVDVVESRAEGRAQLKALAQSAEWVASSAALALIQSANSPEERDEAATVANALMIRQPDQAELLRSAMNR